MVCSSHYRCGQTTPYPPGLTVSAIAALLPQDRTGEDTMPNVHADKLMEIARGLLVAAGASAEEAETIARYNIGANMVGHDSHGIILIPTYIDRIKANHIVPGAPWVITEETPTTTVVDGNWGFGYVVTDRAMRYTI